MDKEIRNRHCRNDTDGVSGLAEPIHPCCSRSPHTAHRDHGMGANFPGGPTMFGFQASIVGPKDRFPRKRLDGSVNPRCTSRCSLLG